MKLFYYQVQVTIDKVITAVFEKMMAILSIIALWGLFGTHCDGLHVIITKAVLNRVIYLNKLIVSVKQCVISMAGEWLIPVTLIECFAMHRHRWRSRRIYLIANGRNWVRRCSRK